MSNPFPAGTAEHAAWEEAERDDVTLARLAWDDSRPSDVDRPGRRIVVVAATDIRPRPVRWLWPDRIPTGALTLLAGREGIGKSLILLDVAARLTRGTLDGSRRGQPSDVLVATAEDAWEYTVVPRLIAADADLKRVFRIDVIDDGIASGLIMPLDVAELERQLVEPAVAMLILDPLTSTMDGRLDAHRDREVRQALEPYARIADATDTAAVGLVHVGKAPGRDPVNLVLGSRAFTAVARLVLVAARNPDDDGAHVLSVEKSNLGRLDMPGLGYRIDSATVDTDEGRADVGRIVWTGETEHRARDLMDADAEEREERDDAADWLRDYLVDHGGEAAAGDAIRAAARDGIAKRTLQRARHRVATKSRPHGRGPWIWSIVVGPRCQDATDALEESPRHLGAYVAPSQPELPLNGGRP